MPPSQTIASENFDSELETFDSVIPERTLSQTVEIWRRQQNPETRNKLKFPFSSVP